MVQLDAAQQYFYGTGKRKTAIARVRLYVDNGGPFIVNSKPMDEYFGWSTWQRIANDAFHEAGFEGNVALAGHGVGAWWHQQEPYMVPSSERVLEEGMVVALEPHIGPCWHLQDMVLVTDGAPRLLSPLMSTDDMLVAG